MPKLHDVIKNKKNNRKYIIIRIFEERKICLIGPWVYALDKASIKMLASSVTTADAVPFNKLDTEFSIIFPKEGVTHE